MDSKVLVTGSTGCIGSATVAYLLAQDVEKIIGFSRQASNADVPAAWADRVSMVAGDIADEDSVRRSLDTVRPTHIIHLAAFQTPDCQAYPFRGMDINVGGTMFLCKAAAALGDHVKRFVCASSIAVHGPRDIYPGPTIRPQDPYFPPSLYGYWKVANEGFGQAYHMETGVPTVSVRLASTYGPGRDRGMTSAPTTAIKAAALGLSYRIPYVGREHYHFVDDVGAGFAQCAMEPFAGGYGVFNLRGRTVETNDFVATLRSVAQDLDLADRFDIAVADDAIAIPFGCDFDEEDTVAAFPKMPLTDLKDGVRASLELFIAQARAGELTEEDVDV